MIHELSHGDSRRTNLTARFAVALFAAIGLLLLTGCAGAKAINVVSVPIQSPAPAALAVKVSVAPDLEGNPDAHRAANELQRRLMKRYTKAGIPVSSGFTIRPARDAAQLKVVIGRADAGNWLRRFAIGFGAGGSVLYASASLEVPGAGRPMLSFVSRAHSGRMPGLILPGGMAAATGKTTSLAISGGLGLFSSGRNGLSRNADRTAKLIVEQTRGYYYQAGWIWPNAPTRLNDN